MLNVAELDERIEKCLAILAENPRSQVFAALADAYRKRGDFGRAFSVCRSGLKQHPDYAPAHIVLAKLYLHQGMHSEAHGSLARAVEIDGPTRASDMLQVEILAAMGDTVRARAIAERLRRNDPKNPAIAELMDRIKASPAVSPRLENEPGSTADATGSPLTTWSDPRRAEPAKPSPLTWAQWEREVVSLPLVERAFSVDADGKILSGISDSDDATPGVVAAMFAEIDAALRQKLDVDLQELRIERSDVQVWCRRRDRGVIGFIGAADVPFGAARQAAVKGAERVSAAAGGNSAANGKVA